MKIALVENSSVFIFLLSSVNISSAFFFGSRLKQQLNNDLTPAGKKFFPGQVFKRYHQKRNQYHSGFVNVNGKPMDSEAWNKFVNFHDSIFAEDEDEMEKRSKDSGHIDLGNDSFLDYFGPEDGGLFSL